MVKIGIQLKANLENVTNLTPVGEDFRWFFKFRCANCGEVSPKWQYISEQELFDMPGGRGEAHAVMKCKLCARENSVTIVAESMKSYTIDDSENFKTILELDCRGVEPIDFSPRNGFSCQSTSSNKKFEEVSLEENEWVDYDDISNQSVGIYEVTHKFIKC